MTPTPARQITAPVMSHRSAGSRPGPFPRAGTCRCRRGCVQGSGFRTTVTGSVRCRHRSRSSCPTAARRASPTTETSQEPGRPARIVSMPPALAAAPGPAPRSRRRPNRSAAPRGGPHLAVYSLARLLPPSSRYRTRGTLTVPVLRGSPWRREYRLACYERCPADRGEKQWILVCPLGISQLEVLPDRNPVEYIKRAVHLVPVLAAL